MNDSSIYAGIQKIHLIWQTGSPRTGMTD